MVSNQLVFTGASSGSVKSTKEASHNEQKSAAVAPGAISRQLFLEGIKECSGTNEEGALASKQSPQIGEKTSIPGPSFDLKGTELQKNDIQHSVPA